MAEYKFSKSRILNNLFFFWITSIFFDAYALAYIGSYPITIFTLVSVLVLILSVVCTVKGYLIRRKIQMSRRDFLAFLLLIWMIINYLLMGMQNTSSLLLACFFVILFLFSERVTPLITFEKQIDFFQRCMDILALYGIYQFVGRINGLPFCDLIFKDHMVTGFNWSNKISVIGHVFWRSNAIFREPSFFSQFLAINILLYLAAILRITTKKNIWLRILLNGIALILSFSGTGILILLVGGILYLIRVQKDYAVKRKISFLIAAAVVFCAIILNTPLGSYFIHRISELFVYSTNAASGYVRFRSGADALRIAWQQNFILGIGIGNVDKLVRQMANTYFGMTVNGFYRPAIELGIVGIVLWLIFIFFIWRKHNISERAVMLQSILFPFMICHETFLSNYYWIILYLLNCTLSDTLKEKGGKIK